MKNKLSLTHLLLAATMLVSTPVFAADEDETAAPFAEEHRDASGIPGNASASNTPPLISGGVGEEDMSHLKAVQGEYNLKFLITEKNGTFLSDIAVHIADLKGHTIVDTTTEGPVLLIKMPAGKYKVTATRHDETSTRKISVGSKGLSAYIINFNNTDERESGDPRSTSLK